MTDFNYDDSNLRKLIDELGMKRTARALKTAMHRQANALKSHAARILFTKLNHVSNRAAMRKTIWTQVYRGVVGFRVTVAGNDHPYPTKPRAVPLGRWLEDGTSERTSVRTNQRTVLHYGANRGTLPRLGFLDQAVQEKEGSISAELEARFLDQIKKTAVKYGCKI